MHIIIRRVSLLLAQGQFGTGERRTSIAALAVTEGKGKAQALVNHFWGFLLLAKRTPTSDEVLRRVGRNLVIFQQIEHTLKLLLANHKNAGHIDNYAANLQTRAESINKKMMGHLVEKYATEVLRDAGEEIPEEERPDDWFSFSFHISGETGFIEGLRRDLKMMTDERNELVHHFLPRWQPGNDEALTETMTYLDAQQEKVLPMYEHLRSTLQHLHESTKSFAEFVISPEYQKQTELMWLQASPLVALMCEVTAQHRRNDGWTYLAKQATWQPENYQMRSSTSKSVTGLRPSRSCSLGLRCSI